MGRGSWRGGSAVGNFSGADKKIIKAYMKNALMICSEITEPGGVTAQALFPSKNSSASRRNFTSDGR